MRNHSIKAWWMVGMTVVAGFAGTAIAASAPRAERTAMVRAESMVRQATTLRDDLTADQRESLMAVSQGWLSLIPGPTDGMRRGVERDLESILEPSQARQFLRILDSAGAVEVPEPPEPAASSCFTASKAGLLFSLTALLGCEGEAAVDATENAYLASANSSMCEVQGAQACLTAAEYANASMTGWYNQLGACELAGASALLEAVTRTACGGETR